MEEMVWQLEEMAGKKKGVAVCDAADLTKKAPSLF